MTDPRKFESRSRTTPFANWPLRGRPAATILGGRRIYLAESQDGRNGPTWIVPISPALRRRLSTSRP